MQSSLSRVAWHFHRLRHAIGWQGGFALLVSVLCVAAYFLLLTPLQKRIQSLQQEARLLRSQAKAKPALQPLTQNPVAQLESYYQFFPQKSALFDGMAKLYNAAAQQGLTLEQGDYKLSPERDLKLVRYDIVLPVKGGYLQLRKFIAQVLEEIPNLSMDGITFNRQKIGDAAIDAQIRFSLYLGES